MANAKSTTKATKSAPKNGRKHRKARKPREVKGSATEREHRLLDIVDAAFAMGRAIGRLEGSAVVR